MKKTLLIATALVTGFCSTGQSLKNHLNLPYKAPVQQNSTVLLPTVPVDESASGSITRATCSDKIKYVDRSGAAPLSNYIILGGTTGWESTFQVYPGYTGQITRVDFQGGYYGSTKTVTVRVHPISGGIPSATVLGTANVSVNAATGEFGATFSSPINVTGGFAVSVKRPTAVTDSVYVLFQTESSFDDFSFLYYGSFYDCYGDLGVDCDMMIRPTISFSIGAPTLSPSPSPTCLGNSVYFSESDPTVAHLGNYVINPNGWLSENLDFGDGTTDSPAFGVSHTYSTSGTKTATGSLVYDGWTTDCPSDNGTATVTINPAPVAGFAWTSVNLGVTFTNMSTDATTYGWQFGDAGTATAPNPVHNYAASGTYTVELTANGPCGSNIFYGNVTVTDSTSSGTSGVVEIENGLLTNIYPNPANNNLTVDLSLVEASVVTMQVISSTGQLVYTKELGNVKSSLQTIDLSGYQSGIYFVRIVHNNKVSSRTFMKN